MGRVKLDISRSVAGMPDAPRGGWFTVERGIDEASTIKQLLTDLSREHPQVVSAIYNADLGRLRGHVMVVLNGSLMESGNVPDVTLRDGDVVVLLAAFSGG